MQHKLHDGVLLFVWLKQVAQATALIRDPYVAGSFADITACNDSVMVGSYNLLPCSRHNQLVSPQVGSVVGCTAPFFEAEVERSETAAASRAA